MAGAELELLDFPATSFVVETSTPRTALYLLKKVQ
jgi:hypothetical protein